jgi:hypothetical protein
MEGSLEENWVRVSKIKGFFQIKIDGRQQGRFSGSRTSFGLALFPCRRRISAGLVHELPDLSFQSESHGIYIVLINRDSFRFSLF